MRGLIFASLLGPCLLGFGSVGCGLIDPDVTETEFPLPEKTYSFDAATFNVPGGISSEIPCGVAPVVDCCNPDPPLPAPDCTTTTLTCEQNENGMNVCTATMRVTQASMVNLGQEVAQLRSFTGFVEIKIKRIGYEADPNTLSIDLPDVELYLAPMGVTDPDPNLKFGTLPAIPAGTPRVGDVALEQNAATVFNMFTQNISTPFNIIATTQLRVTHPPTGRIDMKVTGTLAASL